MSSRISRRLLLAGGLAATATAGPLGIGTASATIGHYDHPRAFDIAERAYFDQGFPDNEGGGYAWGASYYLLGLLRMYQAYADSGYLHRFVDYAREVLGNTDAARGVTDYRGRSGEVWRTAGNYTAGHATVVDGDQNPAVQLRWAGTRAAESTAEISDVADGVCTVTLRNPSRADVVTLPGVSLDPDHPRYLVRAVNDAYTPALRWTAVDLRDAPDAAPPPPAGTLAFESQYYVFAVHTGMVSYPLAMFVRIVGDNFPPQSRLGRFAAELLPTVRATVGFHDHEFVLRPDGTGDYVFSKGAPIPFDGTIEPYNQSHAIGQTLAELHRITGAEEYRRKVAAMCASFRRGLTEDSGAYVWTYWPPYSQLYTGYQAEDQVSLYTPWYGSSQQVEDLSHAAISVEFVLAAAEAGIDRSGVELAGFTRCYTENLIKSDSEVWYRVDGTRDASPSAAVQCARWGAYAQFDPAVYQHALNLYRAVALEPSQGSHALGIAYLNWGRMRGWR